MPRTQNYGQAPAIIGAKFFGQFDETTRNIFALLAFAAGFLVRPFGALVFGRLGDLVGRKYTLPDDDRDHGVFHLCGRAAADVR
jgi:MFS family permease